MGSMEVPISARPFLHKDSKTTMSYQSPWITTSKTYTKNCESFRPIAPNQGRSDVAALRYAEGLESKNCDADSATPDAAFIGRYMLFIFRTTSARRSALDPRYRLDNNAYKTSTQQPSSSIWNSNMLDFHGCAVCTVRVIQRKGLCAGEMHIGSNHEDCCFATWVRLRLLSIIFTGLDNLAIPGTWSLTWWGICLPAWEADATLLSGNATEIISWPIYACGYPVDAILNAALRRFGCDMLQQYGVVGSWIVILDPGSINCRARCLRRVLWLAGPVFYMFFQVFHYMLTWIEDALHTNFYDPIFSINNHQHRKIFDKNWYP